MYKYIDKFDTDNIIMEVFIFWKHWVDQPLYPINTYFNNYKKYGSH